MTALESAYQKLHIDTLMKNALPGVTNVKLPRGFPKQVQGTCGLFALWYAQCLVSEVDTSAPRIKEFPLPRAFTHLGLTKDPNRPSLRFMSKDLKISAQGEILTGDDMCKLIGHQNQEYSKCNYICERFGNIKNETKEAFIDRMLSKKMPVLIAYMIKKKISGGGVDPEENENSADGTHWSVIYAEDKNKKTYSVIDPNVPMTPNPCIKKTLLNANKNVDKFGPKLATKYMKTGGLRKHKTPGLRNVKSGETPDYTFTRKQNLKNVLIGIRHGGR